VQHGVYDTFTKRLAETAGAMMVVDEFGPGACMKAVEKVEVHIADALKKGAKVVTGGKRAAQGGSFFEPTVLTDVTTDMVITKEETFGPVAPLYRFKSEADAIKMANDAPLPSLPRSQGREGRGSPPISTAATSAASGASPRPSNTASSASTKASSRPKSPPSAACRKAASAQVFRATGAQNTASKNSSKSNTSAWAASTGNASSQRAGGCGFAKGVTPRAISSSSIALC